MSKQYYMVVYWVDLGYEVIELHYNPEAAISGCSKLNAQAAKQQYELLVSTGRYTPDQAQSWLDNHGDYYSIEEITLQG